MNRSEIIDSFDRYGQEVHIPMSFEKEEQKNAVIFAHILKAGGSQVAIGKLIPLLDKSGYNVYVVSHEDGVFKDRFVEKYHSVVVIQNSYCVDTDYRSFLQKAFDLVIINSNAAGAFSYYYINTDVPVLWWMHEATNVIVNESKKWIPHHSLTSDNIKYVFPWKKAADEFEEAYGKETLFLPIGISDTNLPKNNNSEKTRFLIPGAYMGFKGFAYALNAIMALPDIIFANCEFTFCGYVIESELFDKMSKLTSNIPNITVLGEVNYEEMLALQSASDCIIVPSLIEAGPLVAVEALMHEKLCIVSDRTGIAEYLTDCFDAFVYDGENVEELTKRILFVATELQNLDVVRQNARATYERNFTDAIMESAWEEIEKKIRKYN